MSQASKGLSITVDQACEQVGGLVLVSSNLNSPKLNDPVPCQAILGFPKVTYDRLQYGRPPYSDSVRLVYLDPWPW